MTAPAVEQGKQVRDLDLLEIFCPCNQQMTLCGIYVGSNVHELTDAPASDCCEDCNQVLSTRGCPYCGCSEEEECNRCAE